MVGRWFISFGSNGPIFRGKPYLQAVSLRECKDKSCWIIKIFSPSPFFNILKLSRLVVFNQPIWKTCESQIGFHLPKVRGEHETYLKPPTRSWLSHGYGLVPEEFLNEQRGRILTGIIMIPLIWPWLQEDVPPSFLVECTFTCLKNTWQKETFIAILFTIVWISNYYQQQSTNKNKKTESKIHTNSTNTSNKIPKKNQDKNLHASIHLLFST